MTNRKGRAAIGKHTVEILERGEYQCDNGQVVSIADPLGAAVAGTRLYTPDDFAGVFAERDAILASRQSMPDTRLNAVNTTTLSAAKTLVDANPGEPVLCLNFASAKNPGGGFLGGSQAQEESLARATGLYACIKDVRGYYDTNRACGTPLYTDHMIYSPGVPVIRDDDDRLIDDPYLVSMITAPAVNAGAVAKNRPGDVPKIEAIMQSRIERVLSLACIHGQRHLVLGAWGCGVFKNDTDKVAKWFREQLGDGATFANMFDTVVFAVLDHSDERRFIGPFEALFAS